MKSRYISGQWIYPVTSLRVQEGVVVMLDDKIIDITSRQNIDPHQIEIFDGIIIPGFINTHCHLELSHLKGKIDSGTGLLPFIQKVVTQRQAPQYIIEAAIHDADSFMWNHGVQAVGDICNTIDTFSVKQKSKIKYYSFIEMFDFLQEKRTAEFTSAYFGVYEKAPALKSAVPHAPYSVSPALFKQINELNSPFQTVSIHNQETQAEEDLFQNGEGGFKDFYKSFNLQLDEFHPSGKSSIHYALQHMDPLQRNLFVHNTLTTREDIEAAHHWSDKVYWATCPNANLYIENKLPKYEAFIASEAKMTIGTDSLTSNWQLSVLEEMKVISKYQSFIDFNTLLQWSTMNGAQALGMDDHLGSLEVGKSPGILCLHFDPDNGELSDHAITVERII